MRRVSALFSILLLLCFLVSVSCVRAGDAEGDEVIEVAEDELAAEIAAEEAAAAAVEEAAEDEEDDDADALDEDADSARYDPERRHPLSELPPPATDVHIGHAFMSGMSSDEKTSSDLVTLGEPVKTIVAFSNQGRNPYHVWGVMGSLNMEKKFSVHVQNFSYSIVNKTVQPSDELSFSYTFEPNARLDIRPFQLAITMFYEAQSSSGNAIRGYSTTFFNSTVATQPGSETMSNGLFMVVFFSVIAAAIGGWYVLRNVEIAKPEPVETGTEEPSKNEWLEEHQNMVKSGGGRAKARSSGKVQ